MSEVRLESLLSRSSMGNASFLENLKFSFLENASFLENLK